jgi:hypothetical protein
MIEQKGDARFRNGCMIRNGVVADDRAIASLLRGDVSQKNIASPAFSSFTKGPPAFIESATWQSSQYISVPT